MRYLKYLFVFFFCSVICVVSTTKIHAAADITLSPTEYLDSTIFNVNVDTKEAGTNGMTLIFGLNGDIQVQDIKEGDTGICSTFDVQKTDTKISITCLENESKAVTGTVAKITATVGNTYDIKLLEDASDLGGLEVGKVTNVEVTPIQEETEEVKSDNHLLLYISAAAFGLLLCTLVVMIIVRKKNK